MKSEDIKKLSIQVMIGGLIGAAAIAVIAVLVGTFNDILGKALLTLFLVMLHALFSLAFIDHNTRTDNKNFKFFENIVFGILVLSFFTSVFGAWGLLTGEIIWKLYLTYFIFIFASLHGQMLSETTGKQSNIDNIVFANYAFMAIVIFLLLPIAWGSGEDFPGFYYRLLAACAIVDATLTILAVILHKLYIQKHPEEQSTLFMVSAQVGPDGKPVPVKAEAQPRRLHPLLWLLGIYLALQIVGSLVVAVMGGLNR